MSHRSLKMLPLVLAISVPLAMAGCRDHDDANAQAAMADQAAAATPSTAQTTPPPTDADTPPASDPATTPDSMGNPSPAPAQSGAAQVADDQQFVRTALAGGMAEVSVSRYVASKAKSGAVRSLAKRIADDHEALNAKLRTAAGADADAVQADDAAKSAEAMIRGSQGAELDKAYLTHMADDHKKDIASFEAAAAQATDPAVRKLAEDALPTLREHAKMVDERLAALK